MSLIKYRIHEVAKDFNVASKVISPDSHRLYSAAEKPHAGFGDSGAGCDL